MQTGKKARNNRTIDISAKDAGRYLKRCLREEDISTDKYKGIKDIADRIISGDSLEIMRHLPKDSVDLIIADPPYNLDKDYNGMKFSRMSDSEYAEYTKSWVELAVPLLKDSGTMYVCCDWRSSSVIYDVLKECLKVRNRITWQREKGRGAKSNWKNSMEDIWFATKSDTYTFNVDEVKIRRRVVAPYKVDGKPKDWEETSEGKFRDTHPSNFWDDISVPFWSMPENTRHPAQKSEKLMAKLILASSNRKDMVFDPFLGSGSSAVTAKKLGRHYLGIERDEQYCVWAAKRLEMADSDSSIQGYKDGIFWERNSGK
jgi:site-specific DNA-methyltransferase (adenine-specific)